MSDELTGFVSGNVRRKQIVEVLEKNGEETAEALSKITRISRLAISKTLEDLLARKVIMRSGDTYSLTEEGKQAANLIKGL